MGEKPCKNLGRKQQKNLYAALPSRRQRKKVEKVLKKQVESIKTLFLKNLNHDVRLIEKQVRSIEPGKGSMNFLNRISIDRKSDWINRNSRKTDFQKNNLIFENLPQSIEYKK